MQPGYDPYAPPGVPPEGYAALEGQRPGVVVWVRIYAILFSIMYLACSVGGVFLLVAAEDLRGDTAPVMIEGFVMVVLGLAFMGLSIVAAAAPRKKWGWIVNLILIGLGCTSCMCLPAAIPLMIFWLKPEARRWYSA